MECGSVKRCVKMKFIKIPREIKLAEFKNTDGLIFYSSPKQTLGFTVFKFSPQYFYSSIRLALSEIHENGLFHSSEALSALTLNLMNVIMKEITSFISIIEDLYFNIELSVETGELDFCFKMRGDSLEDVERKKLFLEEKLKNFFLIDALIPLKEEYLLNFYFKSINTVEIKNINIEKIENTKFLKIYQKEFEDKTTIFHLFLHFNKKIEDFNTDGLSLIFNSFRAFGIQGNLIICIQPGKKMLLETQYFLHLYSKNRKLKDHVDIILKQTNMFKFCSIHEPTVFDIKDLILRNIPDGGMIRTVNSLAAEEELIVKQFLQTYSIPISNPTFQIINHGDNLDTDNNAIENWLSQSIETPSTQESKENVNLFNQEFEQINLNENSVNFMSEDWQALAEYNEYEKHSEVGQINENQWKNTPYIDKELLIPAVPEKNSVSYSKQQMEFTDISIKAPPLRKKSSTIPSKTNLPPTAPQQKSAICPSPKPNLPPTAPVSKIIRKDEITETQIIAPEVPPKPIILNQTEHQIYPSDSGSELDLIDKSFNFESFGDLIQPKEESLLTRVINILMNAQLPYRKISENLLEILNKKQYIYIFTSDNLRDLIRNIWNIKDKLNLLIILFEEQKYLVKYYHRLGLTKYSFINTFTIDNFSVENIIRMNKSKNFWASQQVNTTEP